MDLAKFRQIFLEDSAENLQELSRALLALEKDPADADAIDGAFRMAHSIKGMAASLGYDGITEIAHRLEDRMQEVRASGRLPKGADVLLFEGLAGLERMVAHVRDHGEPPEADPALAARLALTAPAEQEEPSASKKGPTTAPRSERLRETLSQPPHPPSASAPRPSTGSSTRSAKSS
jgi:two-component system chemotaxis sensor kinase CheA